MSPEIVLKALGAPIASTDGFRRKRVKANVGWATAGAVAHSTAMIVLPIGFLDGYNLCRFDQDAGDSEMQNWRRFCSGLVALMVMIGVSASSAAYADSGFIRLTVVKGGWFLGANGGSGTLIFHGRRYPLSIGGIDAGLVFGLSETELYGRVSHIRRASDVAGVYGAGGAGAALVIGARVIGLTNDKGAVLQLQGRQIGLIANLDLSGMVISLR